MAELTRKKKTSRRTVPLKMMGLFKMMGPNRTLNLNFASIRMKGAVMRRPAWIVLFPIVFMKKNVATSAGIRKSAMKKYSGFMLAART